MLISIKFARKSCVPNMWNNIKIEIKIIEMMKSFYYVEDIKRDSENDQFRIKNRERNLKACHDSLGK